MKSFFNKHFLINLLLISLMFNLAACGDLSSEPEDKPVVQDLTCGADLDRFSKIFDELIEDDIECLYKDLQFFSNIVNRDNYLPLTNLLEYLKENEDSYDEDMEDIVKAFFKISYLVRGGKEGFISNKDIDVIVSLLTLLNQEAVKVQSILNDNSGTVTYAAHKKRRIRIEKSLKRIKNRIIKENFFNTSGLRFLNLKELIEMFKTSSNEASIEKTLSVLFLKKLLVGGDKYQITNSQLFNNDPKNEDPSGLFGKLIELGTLSYDLYKINDIKFHFDSEKMEFYNHLIDEVKDSVYSSAIGSSEVATISEVTKAIDLFWPDLIAKGKLLQDFNENITELKDVLFGDKKPRLSFNEVFSILGFGKELVNMGTFFEKSYMDHYQELSDTKPITKELVNCDDFAQNSEEQNNCVRFNRITQKYRYFSGDFKLPYFNDIHLRNFNGVLEIGLLEKVLEKVFVYYDDDGTPASECQRGEICYDDGVNSEKDPSEYTLYLRQVRKILHKFYPLLKELGIVVEGRIFGREDIGSSDNVVLLSSLFQNQSNGSDHKDRAYVEIPEFTEMATSILSAASLRDFFSEKMMELCSGSLINGKVSPDCFRENFLKVINMEIDGTALAIADYLPKLNNYLNELSNRPSSLIRYVKESEKFTRTCMNYTLTKDEFEAALSSSDPAKLSYSAISNKGMEMPLDDTDMFAVFAGLFSVESTLNRFDINGDNRMNPGEISTAYREVYQGVLRNLTKNTKALKLPIKLFGHNKVSRWIFYFLIDKERVPNGVGFFFKKNKVAATRKKIAAILTVIGEQSDSNNPGEKCYNPYCCDVFRNIADGNGGYRSLNKEEYSKVLQACKIKFGKQDTKYPYNQCERE